MAKPTKTRKRIDRAMREVHRNPPERVQRTLRKKGPKAAKRQQVAIALSKARKRGARIPRP